jgi:hypothetical protein
VNINGLWNRVVSRVLRTAGLQVFQVHVRPLAGRSGEPGSPGGMALRALQPEELLQAAADPEMDLHVDFVHSALARGDLAFGAFDGERLVGYTWRTFSAAPAFDGLWISVEPPCQYSYKGFTRRSHRGRHVHAAITSLADGHLLARGYTAEVGIADITNFPGVAVARHMGRRRIGYLGCLKWFGSCRSFRTPAVRRIGVELLATHRAAEDRAGPRPSPAACSRNCALPGRQSPA